ncbi:MAG: hypothetical protein IID33_10185 [Planctomycetes bacterium]|nr:hypothetical protein [Planctomycetota bacterium]
MATKTIRQAGFAGHRRTSGKPALSVRDVAERAASVGLIVVPLVVIALWLTLHHKPGWYHPVELDARGMQRARRQALSTADSISDQMVQRKPFDIVLTDESVTQWIAALGSIWPEVKERIPSEITDIAVAFDDGVVRVGGRYRGSWHAIVNVHLELGMTEDGSTLWIQLLSVYGGLLPIPSSMIERALAGRLGADESASDASNGRLDGADSLTRWIGSPSDHANGPSETRSRAEIENRFVWFNGRRPYRILSIQVGAGVLRLRIEPL